MNGVFALQRAIDFIEEHLTESIDYGDVAGQIYCSTYHFQRMFRAVTGYTLGEYIRFRRLSMAGRIAKHADWNFAACIKVWL